MSDPGLSSTLTPLRRHLMDRLPPLGGPNWIVPCPGCGGAERPRWPFVSDPQTNYAEMHARLSEDGQRVRLSCTGDGRGRRRCSALHLAVVLDLELYEFEPGVGCRQPIAAEPVPEPTPEPAPVAAKPRKAKATKKAQAPYERLRTLVQAILDAGTTEDRESALREASREGLSLPGLDPEQVQQALRGAAQSVGLSENRARAVLRGEA